MAMLNPVFTEEQLTPAVFKVSPFQPDWDDQILEGYGQVWGVAFEKGPYTESNPRWLTVFTNMVGDHSRGIVITLDGPSYDQCVMTVAYVTGMKDPEPAYHVFSRSEVMDAECAMISVCRAMGISQRIQFTLEPGIKVVDVAFANSYYPEHLLDRKDQEMMREHSYRWYSRRRIQLMFVLMMAYVILDVWNDFAAPYLKTIGVLGN